MEEFQIAIAEAEILHRMRNWCDYMSFDGSYDPRSRIANPDKDLQQLAKLETRIYELAKSRASATNRDFNAVLVETQLEVLRQLGRILEKTIDPVLAGLRTVMIEEDGEVCGVCQEEMDNGEEAKAMDCMHKFHSFCIFQWLKRKNTCPLCRHEMQFKESD